jgi:acyl-ACP thioesterase
MRRIEVCDAKKLSNHPGVPASSTDDASSAGAYEVGRIEIDMTEHMKEIKQYSNDFHKSREDRPRRKILVVKFDLVVVMEGKQLKWEVRWPSGAKTTEEIKVRKVGYVSLAPSLMPGTA